MACVLAVIYCITKSGQDVTLKVSHFIIFKVFFLALLIDFLNVILKKKSVEGKALQSKNSVFSFVFL